MCSRIVALIAVLAALVPAVAAAQPANPVPLPIGYLALQDDPRFDPLLAHYEIPVRPWGPSLNGAELGIADGLQVAQEVNILFTIEGATEPTVAAMIGTIDEFLAIGVHFVIVDLPAAMLLELADAVADRPVTLLNVSAQEDSLRGTDCRANVIHIIPSYRMLTDAMAQYLVAKRWRNILVLAGPTATDTEIVEALRQSAANFGARIVDVRAFQPGADALNRDATNVALLTAGANHDVVFVADADGEFAARVPFQTNDARPVVGAAGLVATAWHWAWDRQGAQQLNGRFEYFFARRMGPVDWAAWTAVRAITQSALRTNSADYATLLDFVLSDRLTLDGVKASAMSVRPWDHQLRQPILLASSNIVIDRAPIGGFVHPVNNLDTLGVDAGQSACRM
ncbi:MAG: ABC transporter substrate-binding protein [Bauldia sp.]